MSFETLPTDLTDPPQTKPKFIPKDRYPISTMAKSSLAILNPPYLKQAENADSPSPDSDMEDDPATLDTPSPPPLDGPSSTSFVETVVPPSQQYEEEEEDQEESERDYILESKPLIETTKMIHESWPADRIPAIIRYPELLHFVPPISSQFPTKPKPKTKKPTFPKNLPFTPAEIEQHLTGYFDHFHDDQSNDTKDNLQIFRKSPSLLHPSKISAVSYSPADGSICAVGTTEGTITIYDSLSWRNLMQFQILNSEDNDCTLVSIKTMDFLTEDGQFLAVAGEETSRVVWDHKRNQGAVSRPSIYIFDLQKGVLYLRLQANQSTITLLKGVSFRSKFFILSCGADGSICRWEFGKQMKPVTNSLITFTKNIHSYIHSLDFLPGCGNRLFVASCDSDMKLFDMQSVSVVAEWPSLDGEDSILDFVSCIPDPPNKTQFPIPKFKSQYSTNIKQPRSITKNWFDTLFLRESEFLIVVRSTKYTTPYDSLANATNGSGSNSGSNASSSTKNKNKTKTKTKTQTPNTQNQTQPNTTNSPTQDDLPVPEFLAESGKSRVHMFLLCASETLTKSTYDSAHVDVQTNNGWSLSHIKSFSHNLFVNNIYSHSFGLSFTGSYAISGTSSGSLFAFNLVTDQITHIPLFHSPISFISLHPLFRLLLVKPRNEELQFCTYQHINETLDALPKESEDSSEQHKN